MYAKNMIFLMFLPAVLTAFLSWTPDVADGQVYQSSPPPPTTLHWTQQLAPENRSHDFGVVPGFSKQEVVFEFKNIFEHPIHLIGIRASCGCATPKILTPEVPSGEVAQVLTTYNTKRFKGEKKATISVSVRRDQPYTQYGEIQFQIKGKIRRDVVLKPGTVSFDDVVYGDESVRSVQILYAGNPAWRIQEIKSSNPNITVTTNELQRSPQTNRVDYEMQIRMNGDQQIGTFTDQLYITTNDVKNKNLTVNIQGNVKSVVQVSPVRLGVLSKDQKIEKRLIVRGQRPFGITSVSCADQRIQFTPSTGSKTLHILTYRLDTSNIGQISSNITIKTDDPDQKTTSIPFEAQIVPATFALDGASDQE